MRRSTLRLMLGAPFLAACAATLPPPAAPSAPLTEDPDRRPFAPRPEPYFSPLVWTGADNAAFRPLSRLLAVDPGGEAVNVNTLDEVPDSSWFTNRMGRDFLSPDEAASGPCTTPPLDPNATWTITSAKTDGATPGFVVKSAGRKYLIKFDDVTQGPRPTAADAIGSRIYYAAGFTVPCNRVVFFDRKILKVAPDAKGTSWKGEEGPLEQAAIDLVLSHGTRLADGRYRGSSSLWLAGKSLGPWQYQGTRTGDLNDVVNHEDRRELRGARVLAAWLDHTDSREGNTMTSWISDNTGRGWVRHAFVDFSDCLGDVWDPPTLGRSSGHAYLFDIPQMLDNLFTLGIPQHDWESVKLGPTGKVFGYYDVDTFDPEGWRQYYRAEAFERMTERDAAWMARIIAHFSDQHLQRLVRTGLIGNAALEQFLVDTLRGRRDKVLRRYLTALSPLADPEFNAQAENSELCLRDLAVFSGIRSTLPTYSAATLPPAPGTAGRPIAVRTRGQADVCLELPRLSGQAHRPGTLRIQIVSSTPQDGRLIASLYDAGGGSYTLVGLARVPVVD